MLNTRLTSRQRIPVDVADLNTFFNAVFGVNDIGSGWAIEDSEENIRGCFSEDMADDILSDKENIVVVGYDFILDELDDEQKNKFWEVFQHTNNVLGLVYDVVEENDGNGNGLVYGVIALSLKK